MMNSFSCLRAYGDSVKGLPRCQVATPRNGWWSSGAAPSTVRLWVSCTQKAEAMVVRSVMTK